MSDRFPYYGAIPDKGVASPYYVMLAIPVAERPCTPTMVALAGTVEALVRSNVRFDVETVRGVCHVDDARNVLLRNFLQSECTDLFFIDSDVGWQPNAVLRLLKRQGDIVGGVYPRKSDKEDYPFHPFEGETSQNEDGLFAMPKIPTGFMRIRRHVIEALYEREKAKDRLMWLDGDTQEQNRLPVARICERGFVRELGLEEFSRTHASQSGDYILCLKARSLGFKVFIDPDLEFNHSGEKTWSGNFGHELRRKQLRDTPKFEEAAQAIQKWRAPVEAFDQLVSNSLYMPRSALPGAALQACWEMARKAEGPLLECGSGLSTLVMGLALRGSKHQLYSLENDLDWIERVKVWLDRYGAENVNLLYAPLYPSTSGERWYGVDPEEMCAHFDGVLIDGPARTGAKRSVVFDVLGEHIKHARTWIIDDTEDAEESGLLERLQGRAFKREVATSAFFPHEYIIARTRKHPCGECHLQPGEVCDICGASATQEAAE